MRIIKAGSRSSHRGPETYFTGRVWLTPMFSADAPARARGASVTFEPGARTFWHTHPLGQTIIITEGRGWVQRLGGPIETVTTGDVVWFEPGEKHWHGASSETSMTHLAVHEELDGIAVDWLEAVTEDQYQA